MRTTSVLKIALAGAATLFMAVSATAAIAAKPTLPRLTGPHPTTPPPPASPN